MAVQVFGLSFEKTPVWTGALGGGTYQSGVRPAYGESARPAIYVHVHTDEGPDVIKRLRVSAVWRTVPKNASGGYGSWSDLIWSIVEKTSMTVVQSGKKSGYDWSLKLDDLGYYKGGGTVLTPSGTSVRKEVAPNGWGFASRINDSIEFQLVVVGEYVDGHTDQFGATETNRFQGGAWVTYWPSYQLTSVEIVKDGIDVEYGTLGWGRADDRWALESLVQGGREYAVPLKSYDVTFGYIDAPGYIHIPLSALTALPSAGTIDIDVRLNAGFRDEGLDWPHVRGTYSMPSTSYDCNTPTVLVRSIDATAIVVRVGDAGDRDLPIETVFLKLDGYSDVVTATPGETATIVLPPIGVEMTLQAWGVSEAGTMSTVVSRQLDAVEAGDVAPNIMIGPVGGGKGVRCALNVSEKWSFEPETEKVKFAGRERESVGYGVGGSASGTVECDIIDSAAVGTASDLYDMSQDKAAFEELPFLGTCVVRDTLGQRRLVSVDSVQTSWDVVRRINRVRISMSEVS